MAIFLVVILIEALFSSTGLAVPADLLYGVKVPSATCRAHVLAPGLHQVSEAINTPFRVLLQPDAFPLLGDLTVNGHPSGQWHLHA